MAYKNQFLVEQYERTLAPAMGRKKIPIPSMKSYASLSYCKGKGGHVFPWVKGERNIYKFSNYHNFLNMVAVHHNISGKKYRHFKTVSKLNSWAKRKYSTFEPVYKRFLKHILKTEKGRNFGVKKKRYFQLMKRPSRGINAYDPNCHKPFSIFANLICMEGYRSAMGKFKKTRTTILYG